MVVCLPLDLPGVRRFRGLLPLLQGLGICPLRHLVRSSLQRPSRSHRSSVGKLALGRACSDTAEILGLPEGYRVGVVPASDTGAVEMIMWSVLGQRPVDIFAWESFGSGWAPELHADCTKKATCQRGAMWTSASKI